MVLSAVPRPDLQLRSVERIAVTDEDLRAMRGEAAQWRAVLRRCRCNRPGAPRDEPARDCPAHGEPEVILDELRAAGRRAG